eukprot:712509-Amphidinium_carterae.1
MELRRATRSASNATSCCPTDLYLAATARKYWAGPHHHHRPASQNYNAMSLSKRFHQRRP